MKERKATISEDGGSIEVYSEGKRCVIALGFSVWEWIEIVKSGKNLPGLLAQMKPKEPGDGKDGRGPTLDAGFSGPSKALDASQTLVNSKTR